MKELEYPFDSKYLIAKKKSLRKALLAEEGANRIQKRIAILGGSTTNDIKLMLELFLLNYGIEPSFYESEYNQYYQDAMFPSQELIDFAPDFIYVHTTNRNITDYPTLAMSKEDVDTLYEAEMTKFRAMWDHLAETFHCIVIQNNMDAPLYRLMGNKDVSDIHGAGNFISRLNMGFYEYAQTHDDFYICDLNYIAADYGLSAWADPFYWYMYKYAMNLYAIPYLSYNVANIIKSLLGKNKKGFVLDLDNTLWGGVIGDDGVDNIELGPEESVGQAYTAFQKYLKAHKQFGIILNVDSKNDYENAIAGLNHQDSELKPEEFIVIKANWNPKNLNFQEIADELTLLPESLVFVDDNPAERAIVAEQLPGVVTPPMEDVQTYIRTIDRAGYFEVTNISADDLKRNQMYKDNAERAQLQAKYENYSDYLLSLEMKGTILPFESVYMQRIAQLTNKSNQFNLTTKRFTQDEIEATAADNNYITLYGKLEDRFGDNGVVSVVIGHVEGEECHMDLWLMSCRVLKRDMEFAMMDTLVEQCKARGVKRILGYYYPTKKNKMVQEFYGLQGFRKISEDEVGNTTWEFIIPEDYQNKNQVIAVNVDSQE